MPKQRRSADTSPMDSFPRLQIPIILIQTADEVEGGPRSSSRSSQLYNATRELVVALVRSPVQYVMSHIVPSASSARYNVLRQTEEATPRA